MTDGSTLNGNKDGGPLDWYLEGPGRRVGYDDLTAIDWIFEYTKERQRLRMLYSRATGLIGHLQQMMDASQIWIVLVGAGLLSGVLAAVIDVVSDWLGDLKTGYCQSGAHGGQFYLNRGFCCWGHEGNQWLHARTFSLTNFVESTQCQGWKTWGEALHIRSSAGQYIIEYILFILYSVWFSSIINMFQIKLIEYNRPSLLSAPAF